MIDLAMTIGGLFALGFLSFLCGLKMGYEAGHEAAVAAATIWDADDATQ